MYLKTSVLIAFGSIKQTMMRLATRIALGIVTIIATDVIDGYGVDAFSLKGKTALVTGSAGGIGKGIARILAKKGAKIIIHYHEREKEAYDFARNELGPEKCLGVLQCDFRDIQSIPSFFQQARDLCSSCNDDEDGQQQQPKLDVLINNAGAITKMALDDDDDNLTIWLETMAVNLHAPNLLGKLFAEQFKRDDQDHDDNNNIEYGDGRNGDGGIIINVSSIHGDRSNEYMGAYAASKAALESLTRTMAIEYAPLNIRANAIAPGIVPVERTAQIFKDSPQILESWTEKLPLQKAGTVEEVATACLPLIENEWITGVVWQIDGGMMARANMPQRSRP